MVSCGHSSRRHGCGGTSSKGVAKGVCIEDLNMTIVWQRFASDQEFLKALLPYSWHQDHLNKIQEVTSRASAAYHEVEDPGITKVSEDLKCSDLNDLPNSFPTCSDYL